MQINGYSQTGSSAGAIGNRAILVQINGNGVTTASGSNVDAIFQFTPSASGIGSAARSSISGLSVYNSGSGITPINLLPGLSHFQCWGNYIGTLADGYTAGNNGWSGIELGNYAYSTTGTFMDIVIGKDLASPADYSQGNVIGNNVGSSNASADGITFGTSSTNYVFSNVNVSGNYIGINAKNAPAPSGSSDGLSGDGIHINQAASGGSIIIGSNGDNNGDAQECNVLSYNGMCGIDLGAGGSPLYNISNVAIGGNYIGTDTTGTAAAPNGLAYAADGGLVPGIQVNGILGYVLIGATDSVANPVALRNVISGNSGDGMDLLSTNSGGKITVAGNYIGVDATGNKPLPNGDIGIEIYGCTNILIGTNGNGIHDALEGNVISANPGGGIISVSAIWNSVIAGNKIGVGADGITALGNRYMGIDLWGGNNNRIGSNDDGVNDAAEANIIANTIGGTSLGVGSSPGVGLTVRYDDNYGGVNNRISRNNFYNNGGLPIDLNDDGITLNDGSLTGNTANQSIDYPVFTSQTITSPTSVTVSGYIGNSASTTDSTAGALLSDGTLTVQLYKQINDGNQNGGLSAAYNSPSRPHGEGLYLGSFSVSGSTFFNQVVTNLANTVAMGDTITGIVIDANGNTSEFGAAVFPVQAMPVSLSSPLQAYVQGSSVLLKWATATETNCKDFTIQHSADGKNWTATGTINSKAVNGNSNAILPYTYTDASPDNGENYYRLMQTDLDGTSVVLGTVSAYFSHAANGLLVYPNPATNGTISVAGLTVGANVTIYNINGQLVKSCVAASTAQQIDISALSKGVYFVKVLSGTNKSTTTFIVR